MPVDNPHTMPRALQIPELLDIIFRLLCNPDESSGLGNLVALARTARCFEETALNVLWENQLTIVPLLRCFPEDIWKETMDEEGFTKFVTTVPNAAYFLRLPIVSSDNL